MPYTIDNNILTKVKGNYKDLDLVVDEITCKLPTTLVRLSVRAYNNSRILSIPIIVNLKILDLQKHPLTMFDFSGFEQLFYLQLKNCGLTTVILPSNSRYVYLDDNRITTINLNIDSLTHLSLNNNGIETFTVPTNLTTLSLSNNRIQSIEIPSNIECLHLNGNLIETIKLPNSVQFYNLSNNNIKTFTTPHNTIEGRLDYNCIEKLNIIQKKITECNTLTIYGNTVNVDIHVFGDIMHVYTTYTNINTIFLYNQSTGCGFYSDLRSIMTKVLVTADNEFPFIERTRVQIVYKEMPQPFTRFYLEKQCPACHESECNLLLSCGHMGCEQCFKPWIEKTKQCPVCRTVIIN